MPTTLRIFQVKNIPEYPFSQIAKPTRDINACGASLFFSSSSSYHSLCPPFPCLSPTLFIPGINSIDSRKPDHSGPSSPLPTTKYMIDFIPEGTGIPTVVLCTLYYIHAYIPYQVQILIISLLLSSLTRRRFYPQRASGRAVGSQVSTLLPPRVTRLYFQSRMGFSNPTARRFPSNVANSLFRAFR